jgi:hypothetical protein
VAAPGKTNGGIDLDGRFAFHPSLQPLKPFWDNGNWPSSMPPARQIHRVPTSTRRITWSPAPPGKPAMVAGESSTAACEARHVAASRHRDGRTASPNAAWKSGCCCGQ